MLQIIYSVLKVNYLLKTIVLRVSKRKQEEKLYIN